MDDKELQRLIYHLSLIFINLASFLFNLLIVVIFVHYRERFFQKQKLSRRLRATNHNKFLLSMVVADALVGLFGTLTGILLKFSSDKKLIFKLCGLIPVYGSMFVSILSLVLLTIDRVIAIRYPFKYDSLMTNFRVTCSIALSWIIPFLGTVSLVIIYVTKGLNIELKVRNTFITFYSLTGFTVLVLANLVLIKKVKEQRARAITLKDTSHQLKADAIANAIGIEKRRASDPGILRDSNRNEMIDSVYSTCFGEETSIASEAVEGASENKCPRPMTMAYLKRCDTSKSITMKIKQFRRQTLSFPVLEQEASSRLNCLSSLSKIRSESTEILTTYASQALPHKTRRPSISGDSTDDDLDSEYSLSTTTTQSQSTHAVTKRKTNLRKKFARKLRDRKITIMCICIVVAFFICWLPLVGYRLSYVAGRTKMVQWFGRLTQTLAMSNSLLNPFIYFLLRKDFRHLFKKLIRI